MHRVIVVALSWAVSGGAGAAEVQYGAPSASGGAIVGYTTAPEGSMDGFTLDSGTTVRFPAYAGSKLLPFVARGAQVTVTGTIRAGGRGPVLEASKVTNQCLGSVDVAAIPPPAPLGPAWQAPPPRGAVAPPGAAPLTPPSREFP